MRDDDSDDDALYHAIYDGAPTWFAPAVGILLGLIFAALIVLALRGGW